MKRTSKKQPESSGSQQFQMLWSSANNAPTIYANQLFISYSGLNEFYLVFGEVQLPIAVDPQNPPAAVEVRPLVKIVVVPEVMQNIVKALNDLSSRIGQNASGESDE